MERMGLHTEEGNNDDQTFCEAAQHSPFNELTLDTTLSNNLSRLLTLCMSEELQGRRFEFRSEV